jgi:deoxyribodipyrimidine photo-lyase
MNADDKTYRLSLFIFRRDLRLQDNSGLNAALDQSERVLPCFILDPRQIEPHPYQSAAARQFLGQCLTDLDSHLQAQHSRLALYQGLPATVIRALHQRFNLDAVFSNCDYTPFSRQRDQELAELCRSLGIAWHSCDDLLLTRPQAVLNQQQRPYQVFTAFYANARHVDVALPQALATGSWCHADTPSPLPDSLLQTTIDVPQRGGRDAALLALQQLPDCRDYAVQRDLADQDRTSHLSAYLKFGCCSVREVYYAVQNDLGPDHPLIRQLYWRDFFHHIAYHQPRVFGHAYQSRFEHLPWRRDMQDFRRWSEGSTGFPIIDAAMRQLNRSGWMPNRLRMVVASFLCKDLFIGWRWGERYFAQQLFDYDPCLNNGNWQWAASTGCDAQPYFRIFNPWLQQQKFDADCLYIKRWLPELADLPASTIHNWHKTHRPGAYPKPMLDHAAAAAHCKAMFTAAANQPKRL